METDYLKSCFGNGLTQALAEVAKVRPSDPIEYLAHWLLHHRTVAPAREELISLGVSTKKGHLHAGGRDTWEGDPGAAVPAGNWRCSPAALQQGPPHSRLGGLPGPSHPLKK